MLLRHSILYLPAQTIGPVCQFLAVVAWTHFLAPAELGHYNLAVSLQELFFYSLFSWWSFYTLRSIGHWSSPDDRKRYEETESSVILGLTVIETILAPILLLYFVDGGATVAFIATFLLFALTRSVLLYLAERTRAAHQIKAYTVIQVIPPVLGLLLGFAMVYAWGGDAIWPLAGFAIAQLVALVAALAYVPALRSRLIPDREVLKAALTYGMPLMLGGLVYWVSTHANRFIVDHFLDRASVGLFSVATGLAERSITVVVALVAPAIFPLAVAAMENEGAPAAMQRLKGGATLNFMLLIPAVAGAATLARPIATLFLGADYGETAAEILPLAALSAGLAVWTIPAQAFMLHHRSDLSTAFAALDAILGVLLSFILVPRIGIMGAVIARVAASSFALVCAVVVAKRQYGLLLPVREVLLFLLSAGIMAGVLRFCPVPASVVALLAMILLGALVYALSLAVFFRQEAAHYGASLLH